MFTGVTASRHTDPRVNPLTSAAYLTVACAIALLLCGCGGESSPKPSSTASRSDDSIANMSVEEASDPDPEIGRQMYLHACATCHGNNAQGMPHQGANLRTSKFLAEKSDQQLLDFLQVGRPQTDKANLSGVLMPPRGGNAALDDDRLRDVIAYLRQIRTEASPVARAAND